MTAAAGRRVPVVDTHSHFWPRAMVDALDRGQPWHGWRRERTAAGGETLACSAGTAPFLDAARHEAWDARRAHRRAEQRIDVELVMVPSFLWNYHLPPADGAAFCRDVNDELADLQRSRPDVFGLGVLPLQDRAAAVAEADRAVGLGLRGFAIGTNVQGRNLDDPEIVAALEHVVETGAAIMLHATYFDRAGADRLPRYAFSNSFGVPLECGLAVMSLVYAGLLDRHPDARIASTHGGGWLPYGIGRLALRHDQGRAGRLEEPPETYLRRLYYDCLLHDELSMELLARRVGVDRLMVGTDYPFGGDLPGGAVSWISGLTALTAREKDLVLGVNARRFLGYPPLPAV